MDNCANHPTHRAAEHCEVCGRALCGLCLWYSEDGRRLCEMHARELRVSGEKVWSPDAYADAIRNSILTAQPSEFQATGDGGAVFRGNNRDLTSLIVAVLALSTLFSCMGGIYCLPIAALILGVVTFVNAEKAVNPKRTRTLSAIGFGIGGCISLVVIVYLTFILAFVVLGILSSSGGP